MDTSRKAYRLVRIDEDKRVAWPASDLDLEVLAEVMERQEDRPAIYHGTKSKQENKMCGKHHSQYRAGGPCDHCGVTGAFEASGTSLHLRERRRNESSIVTCLQRSSKFTTKLWILVLFVFDRFAGLKGTMETNASG